jgi:hypothetical protein
MLEVLFQATEPLMLLVLLARGVTGLTLGAIRGVGGLFGLVVMEPYTDQLPPTLLLLCHWGSSPLPQFPIRYPPFLSGSPALNRPGNWGDSLDRIKLL